MLALLPASAAANSDTQIIVKRDPGLTAAERADIRADADVRLVETLPPAAHRGRDRASPATSPTRCATSTPTRTSSTPSSTAGQRDPRHVADQWGLDDRQIATVGAVDAVMDIAGREPRAPGRQPSPSSTPASTRPSRPRGPGSLPGCDWVDDGRVRDRRRRPRHARGGHDRRRARQRRGRRRRGARARASCRCASWTTTAAARLRHRRGVRLRRRATDVRDRQRELRRRRAPTQSSSDAAIARRPRRCSWSRAGNGGRRQRRHRRDARSYPCAYDLPNVLCVGATRPTTTSAAAFSNYGERRGRRFAPGVRHRVDRARRRLRPEFGYLDGVRLHARAPAWRRCMLARRRADLRPSSVTRRSSLGPNTAAALADSEVGARTPALSNVSGCSTNNGADGDRVLDRADSCADRRAQSSWRPRSGHATSTASSTTSRRRAPTSRPGDNSEDGCPYRGARQRHGPPTDTADNCDDASNPGQVRQRPRRRRRRLRSRHRAVMTIDVDGKLARRRRARTRPVRRRPARDGC